MMKSLTFLLLLATTVSFAQGSNSQFSAELKFATVSGLDNKFFKDSFSLSPGLGLGINIKTISRLYVVLDYKVFFMDVKDPAIYADFNTTKMQSYSIGPKYTFPLAAKWDAEAKALVGGATIEGNVYIENSRYAQQAFSISIAGSMVYHISQKGVVDIVGGIGLQRFFSKIKIDQPDYSNYYNNSWLLAPEIGIRFNFK